VYCLNDGAKRGVGVDLCLLLEHAKLEAKEPKSGKLVVKFNPQSMAALNNRRDRAAGAGSTSAEAIMSIRAILSI
jgi:hypothetical protein